MVAFKTNSPGKAKTKGVTVMPKKTVTRVQEINKRKTNHKNDLPKVQVDIVKMKKVFKRKAINKLAQASGFIQRKRKLEAFDFFYH